MDNRLIDKVVTTPLNKINVEGGDVYHAMKKSDGVFEKFGEAYFSFIEEGYIKAWKKHKFMTLNLIVPIGKVQFVLYDEYSDSFHSEILSPRHYNRLTVPPNLWFGFKGLQKGKSMLLNIADIEHDPDEVERLNVNELEFNWSQT